MEVDATTDYIAGTFFAAASYTLVAAPAIDNFANATILSGNSGIQTGTHSIGCTLEDGEPDCVYSGIRTVWFKWTCP